MLKEVTNGSNNMSVPPLTVEQASHVLAYLAATIPTEDMNEKAICGRAILFQWLSDSLASSSKRCCD